MGTVYDYLKGLNKSAFNVFNPFSNESFTKKELEQREENFSNPSYIWNSYYLQREKMEETLDRINTINKMKELRVETKELRAKFLGRDIEETEETKKMFDEYDKELEELEFQKKLQTASLNYAQKSLGGIQKFITAPLYDVLVDVSNPTDTGDLISVGRVGVALASAGVGSAVAQGATNIGIGTVGGVVATEAAVSVADTALDVARIQDETGEEVELEEIAKLYGTNVASGLIMNGLMTGVGYAFGKAFQKVKNRVNTAGASAMNSPNASSMADDITPNPKMSDAPVEALKQALGEETGEQMADIIKPTQATKFDSFSSVDDGVMSVTVDMGTTTPTERKIMNLTLAEFKEKNKIKNVPEGEFLNLPNTKELIQQEMVNKSNKIMVDFSNMAANFARNFANLAQDKAKIKNVDPNNFINKDALFVKEWVNSLSILKEQAAEKLSKQVNLNISSRGSELGINNYVDFVKFSEQNGVDILKSMYTDTLPSELPQAYKEVFGYLKDLTYKYSIEVTPREVFSESDELLKLSGEYKLDGLFVGMDYTPSDWDFESLGVPMMINPKLTKNQALDMINKVRSDLQQKLTGRVDIEKAVRDYADSELISYDEGISKILKENISQSRANIIDRLRNYGLNKRQAKSVYSFFNKARLSSGVDTTALELVDTITKDFSKRNTIKNRLFNFIPKNQAMVDEDLFMVTKIEGTDINKTIKNFAPQNEVETNRNFTKEQLDRRDKIVEMTSKYLGGSINPRVEKAFWGFDLPLAQGRSKTVDIRTTDITELADAYWEKNGVLKIDWRELSEQDKIKFLDEVATKFYNRLVTRVGEFARQQTGISDVTTYVDNMLTKWGIPQGLIDVKINEGAEKFQGYFKRRGKVLVLDFPSDVSSDLKLGVARHELQHIYDDVVLGAFDDPSFRTSFKNKPTVEGKEIFSRINNSQPVTIREFLGSFYDNHFYSPMNDNFENSYLAAAARDKFSNRTPYEKAQDFYSLLKATTQGRTKSRTNVKEIFRFLEGAEDIPDYLDNDFYQDFAIKSFISPEDMFDYVNFLANTGNNRMKNITSNYSKIISRMTTEEQGFSINTLLNQLNTSKIKKDLLNQGVEVDDLLNNTNAEKVLYSIREGVRERFIKTGSREFDPLSFGSLFSSGITSALIGSRQFVEATVSPVAAGISHILNGGNISEAALMTIKNYPLSYKNYFKSYIYGTGTIVENVGDFFNANINAMTKTLLDRQFEQTFTLHLADTLHKIGDIRNSDISLYDAKLFGDFVTQMAILNSGGNPEAFLGKLARIFNKGIHGNKADDIQLQAIAQSVAKSEFNKMLGVSSISQLNQVQKKMYSMSGFSNENFNQWQEYARRIVEKNGLELPDDAFSLKMMLAQGEGAVDIMGMSRRTATSSRNPFLYMCQTMFNAALLSLQKLRATSVNGLSIDHMDTNIIAKLMGITALGVIGVGATMPKQEVEKILFGNKTSLEELQKAYETFEQDKTKGSYEIATTLLDAVSQQTPLAYTLSPSSNAFGVLGAAYSLADRNIYDFSAGEARSPWLTLSVFAAPIVSSRLLTLAKRFDFDNGPSTPINKTQLKKQLANDIETYLPYSYRSTSKKLRRQQKMNEFSVWGK